MRHRRMTKKMTGQQRSRPTSSPDDKTQTTHKEQRFHTLVRDTRDHILCAMCLLLDVPCGQCDDT
jgi:hypothetical protein